MIPDNDGIVERTLHDDPIGAYRSYDIIHLRQRVDQIFIVDRAGKVEEHIIEISLRKQILGIGQRLFGIAFHDRIGFLLQASELLVGHAFVVLIFERHF